MAIKVASLVDADFNTTLACRSMWLPVRIGLTLTGSFPTEGLNFQQQLDKREECRDWLSTILKPAILVYMKYIDENVFQSNPAELAYQLDRFEHPDFKITNIAVSVDVKYDPNKNKAKSGLVSKMVNSSTSSALEVSVMDNDEALEVLNHIWYAINKNLKVALDHYLTMPAN